MTKDDDGDIDRTEDGEFMGFLEETTLSFQKGSRKEQVSRRAMKWKLRCKQDKAYTERLRSSLIALISIFLRPIVKIDTRREGE